jgi:hypothetical protein
MNARMALAGVLVAFVGLVYECHDLHAYDIQRHGHIWKVELSSAENEISAVVLAGTLGQLPKIGGVFITIAKLMTAADVAGGFKGTEAFGVGGVLVVILPPGNL